MVRGSQFKFKVSRTNIFLETKKSRIVIISGAQIYLLSLKFSFVKTCSLEFRRRSLEVIHLLNYAALTDQLYALQWKRRVNHFVLFYLVNVFKEFYIIVQLLKIVTILNPFFVNVYLWSMAVCNYGANKLLLFFSSSFSCIQIIYI